MTLNELARVLEGEPPHPASIAVKEERERVLSDAREGRPVSLLAFKSAAEDYYGKSGPCTEAALDDIVEECRRIHALALAAWGG
jgi:hypothetical protein